MSKRPERHNPLGGLKDEVLSALRLLFRKVDAHGVNVSLDTSWTAYTTDIAANVWNIPLATPLLHVSADPVQALQELPTVRNLALIPEVRLADAAPCQFDPVPCREPVFEEMSFAARQVSLDNLSIERSAARLRQWPISRFAAQSRHKDIPKTFRVTCQTMPSGKLQTRAVNPPGTVLRARSREESRFYGLPIRKMPVPPHRFPIAMRDRFRRALAEKAKTRPDNVQLRIVFERLDMSLYASIQQDDQGNLLCHPRNELLGRNVLRQNPLPLPTSQPAGKAATPLGKPSSGGGGSAYLVYGFRFDTKEDIRTLVPVEEEA